MRGAPQTAAGSAEEGPGNGGGEIGRGEKAHATQREREEYGGGDRETEHARERERERDRELPAYMAQHGSPAQHRPSGSSSAGRLFPHPDGAASSLTSNGGGGGGGIKRDCHASSLPPPPQHGSAAVERRHRVDPRQELSRLLSSNLTTVASGRFATGRAFDPRLKSTTSCEGGMPQACMPRIKLKAMASSLALPLSSRQADRLKEAQVGAGQERDVNADGVPETRLPWAARPDVDFKIVNHKAWSAGVVAPVVRQVYVCTVVCRVELGACPRCVVVVVVVVCWERERESERVIC